MPRGVMRMNSATPHAKCPYYHHRWFLAMHDGWLELRRGLRSAWLGRYLAFAVSVALVLFTACSAPAANASIGVVLGRHKVTGALHVREVPPGLAGDLAGLRPGDRIKMIDGILVDRVEPARIRELLRGPVGSKVMLTIVRGNDVLHLEVTRAPLGAAPASSAPAAKGVE